MRLSQFIFIVAYTLTILHPFPSINCNIGLLANSHIKVERVNATLLKKLQSTNASSILQKLDEELSLCGSNQIDIRELTIAQVRKYFETGILTSKELTLCYLARISKIDYYLKSVIEINPDALSIAYKCDMERILQNNKTDSLLHGIPILIKDNIATFDLMQTTVGAIAMEFLKPREDARVVQRLRDAGAVILGKTNPSEWAVLRGDNVPSGWSGRGGQSLSPYVLTLDPSGSSTGSAVAIAANLVMVALGTETDGSIISPSARNSIIGLKPTVGSVSTKGVIPLSFTQDVVGPMARTTVDAAILMEIISERRLNNGCGTSINLDECLEQKKFTVGVLRDPFWSVLDPTLKVAIPKLEECLNALKKSGRVSVVDPVEGDLQLLDSITYQSEMTVFLHEFKIGVNKYINNTDHFEHYLGCQINSLADIIKFNTDHPSSEGFNQNRLILAECTDGLNNETYKRFRKQNLHSSQQFLNEILNKYQLDVIASPCYSFNNVLLYSYGAFAGYPSISIPVGLDEEDMPTGICFLGRPNSEDVLLKLANLLEIAYPMRKRPSFKS